MPTTVTVAGIADATEGGSTGTFTVSRSSSSGSLSVNLSYSGTASAGDYAANPLVVMFTNGQSSLNVTITAVNDSTSEATETLVCTVGSGTGYTVGSPASATINILDNDAQYVSVAKVNDAAEGGTDGVFRFSRIGNLSNSLTVNYSVGGTASNGTDFTALSGSVTFAANSATADVSVDALHDGVNEAGETVGVTVTSGTGYTVGSPSSATVNVIDTDILPEAFDSLATASVNTPIELDVLDLATSLYGDELTVTAVTQGEDGTVGLDGDTVTYTPDTDFVGDDSFTFTVEDAFGNEATGTMYVTITAIAAPLVSIWTDEEEPVNIDVTEVAFDLDEDELTVTAVTQGSDGTVTIETDGTITYTPNTSFAGEDSFTYTVEDPEGNEATGTITVTVGETDPVSLDDSAETAVNTPVNVEVLDLAFQPAGGGVTTTAVTQGDHGTVTIELDGSVTYTPDTSYTGTDTFTYTVTDGNSNTGTGTITVQVGPADPSDADEIMEDLADIEDAIDNYDVNDPPDLASALTAVISDINGYLAGVTTYISTNSIDTTGGNKSITDFLDVIRTSNFRIYGDYLNLKNTESLLWGLAIANKNLIESLNQQLKTAQSAPTPNQAEIAALKVAVETLREIQFNLRGVHFEVWRDTGMSFIEASKRHFAALAAFKGNPPAWLDAPSPPPVRFLQDTIPRP